MGRPSKLSRSLIKDVAKRIKVGCYPHIAAAACGIAKSTFYRWLAQGKDEVDNLDPVQGRPSLYAEFWDSITQAYAEARVAAEARVFIDNPLAWLREGPGKEDWIGNAPMQVILPGSPQDTITDDELNAIAPPETFAEAMAGLAEMGLLQLKDGRVIDLEPEEYEDADDDGGNGQA